METMIWVAVIVIAAILEGMSAQLISIWFVGGGIAGMIAQLCGAAVWLQVLIAGVVGVEFGLDKSGIAAPPWYGAMILLLVGMAGAEGLAVRRELQTKAS